jgi:hypothetical protein
VLDGGFSRQLAGHMITDALDPLIHLPARLRLMVALAALPDGDGQDRHRRQRT